MVFTITSTSFKHGEKIPVKYTCDGEDVSPEFEWSNVPEGARSFTLIADDPDAPIGTWIHWVLYNVSVGTRSISEATPAEANLPDGSRHGKNSWGRLGYGGPCPPSGTHRYFFRLYALDNVFELRGGASEADVQKAMKGHILAETELMGLYSRK